MFGSIRSLLAAAAVGAITIGSLTLAAPAAVASPQPESLTILTTQPLTVTSSTGKPLELSLSVVRHSANSSNADKNTKGSITITLANPTNTESHAWTFNLAKHSFTTSAGGAGKIVSGKQILPLGKVNLAVTSTSKGVKKNCGAGDFEIDHQVALKGKLKLITESKGSNAWGAVTLGSGTLNGKLYGGHGPDNEEACGGFPPCVNGVSWLASKGNLTVSGQSVAKAGKPAVSTIDGNRFVELAKPAGAFRIDDVTTTVPAPALHKHHGKATLTVTTNNASPAQGDAALASTGNSPYDNGCAGGQEKGTLWNAKYITADLPLTLTEDVFGPMQIAQTKSATFEQYHIA